MKKIVLASVAIISLSASLLAANNHNLGLVSSFPHPMKVFVKNPQKLDLTKTQQASIDSIMNKVPAKVHAMFDEAELLEKNIRKALIKDALTKEQLKPQLDKLQTLKREITELQIDTISEIRSILNKDQFQKMLKILKKMKHKKGNKNAH